MRFLTLLCILLPYALLCFLKSHAFWGTNGFEKGRDTFYWTESAMHLYLTDKAAKGEPVSGLDTRAQYPEGLDLSRDITMGMPLVIGQAYKTLKPAIGLDEFVGQFSIFFSSLTVIAIFLIAGHMYGSLNLAMLSSLLYAAATATTARSAGAYIFEDFSLPLIMFSFFFLMTGIESRKIWRVLLSGLLMSGALVSWHFTQFILLTAGLALCLIAFTRFAFDREQGLLFTLFTAILIGVSAVNPLLRADGIFVSPAVTLFAMLSIYLVFPTRSRAVRFGGCVLCAMAFFAAYAQLGLKDEGHVFSIFLEKLKSGLVKPADPGRLSFETRAMWIEDDNSPNLYSLLYIASFYLPLGLIAMFRTLREQWQKVEPLNAFVLLMGIGFLILYFMARRLLSIEIIFLSLLIGSLASWRNAATQRFAMIILLVAIGLEGIKTYGYGLNGKIDNWANELPKAPSDPTLTTYGDQLDIIDWVESQTGKEDPILTAIGLSPVLLSRTGRPVVLHSKFEAHGLRDKFENFIVSLFSSEDDFFAFFKKLGTKYFIYESKTALFDKADSYRYMANQLAINESSAAYQMHFKPEVLKHFDLVYQNPGYRVFREKTNEPLPPTPLPLIIYDETAIKTWGKA